MEGYRGRDRLLKAPPLDWPEDFEIDIAVNGKIVKTYDYATFKPFTAEYAYNEAFYPLIDDPAVQGDVELGVRIRSTINPQYASFTFTHIYWD